MGFSHLSKKDNEEGHKPQSEDQEKSTSANQQQSLQDMLSRLQEESGQVAEGEDSKGATNGSISGQGESKGDQGKDPPVPLTQRVTGLLTQAQRTAIIDRIGGLLERYGPWSVPVSKQTAEAEEASEKEGSVMRGLQKRMERLLSFTSDTSAEISSTISRVGVWEDLKKKVLSIVAEAQSSISSQPESTEWDFDTLLFEDLPAAMDYVGKHSACTQKDRKGKILAVGHSMGGILLYSRLAVMGEKRAGLAGVVTLASSMDYSASSSSFKLLLPLEGPIRLSSFKLIPTALLARAALPLILQPPYSLAWVGYNISAREMMEPGLFRKLMRLNFETIPVRLLLQLASLFYKGGLRDRGGAVEYFKGLRGCRASILAVAADRDLVCPPEAVQSTADVFGEGAAEFVRFGGEEGGPSYSHYDLLVSKLAKQQVYPVISEFLVRKDSA